MIVKSGFESISGVKVISLSFDDENNFSHVKINVKNKGDIQFIAFRPKYFNNPEHLDIYSIGLINLLKLFLFFGKRKYM